ncbi:MAG: hypothetical protein C0597_03915 [Marinilabiliales bacterium]|nr:MAG: hypothetical protein C0597_03915 [Marinilabiliales bacterium]
MNNKNIPQTGRIGRFARILETKANQETFEKIMINSPDYNAFKAEQKAEWWKNAVEKLEKELGKDAALEVMRTCGSKCCGAGQRKTAKHLMAEATSLKVFLEKFVNYGVKNGALEYEIIDDSTFITKHNKCFCGQVKKSKELFKTNTYCQCSVEFNKQFFEAAFERPVQVKLNKSILNGDKWCEFEIKH